jgi:hypothetical protein
MVALIGAASLAVKQALELGSTDGTHALILKAPTDSAGW